MLHLPAINTHLLTWFYGAIILTLAIWNNWHNEIRNALFKFGPRTLGELWVRGTKHRIHIISMTLTFDSLESWLLSQSIPVQSIVYFLWFYWIIFFTFFSTCSYMSRYKPYVWILHIWRETTASRALITLLVQLIPVSLATHRPFL